MGFHVNSSRGRCQQPIVAPRLQLWKEKTITVGNSSWLTFGWRLILQRPLRYIGPILRHTHSVERRTHRVGNLFGAPMFLYLTAYQWLQYMAPWQKLKMSLLRSAYERQLHNFHWRMERMEKLSSGGWSCYKLYGKKNGACLYDSGRWYWSMNTIFQKY